MSYQPKTGQPCDCRRGVQRDNCPACEGTGERIDFAAIRASAERRSTLQWNRPTLGRFKLAYAEHRANPAAVFDFEGHTFVVQYAKYLIEYLERVLR